MKGLVRGLGAALVILAVASPVLGPAVAQEVAAGCDTVNILAFRGSGEKQTTTDQAGEYIHLESDRWEGPTVRRALKAFEVAADTANVSTENVRILDVGWDAESETGYEAVDLLTAATYGLIRSAPVAGLVAMPELAHSYALVEIYRSSKTGVAAGLKTIEDVVESSPRSCSEPQFVAVGYSQGAMAARLIYDGGGLGEQLDSIMTIGDPFQTGQDDPDDQEAMSLHGTGADGTGMFTKKNLWWVLPIGDSLDKESLERFYTSPANRYSLCHDEDPYCDYNSLLSFLNVEPHNLYVKVGKQLGKDEAAKMDEKDMKAAAAESEDVGEWLVTAIGSAASSARTTPAPAELGMTVGPSLWIAGWEGRLDVTGLPEGAELTVTLKPEDGQDVQVTAIPSQNVGDRGMTTPPYMDRGSHGIDLPADLAEGIYDVTIETRFGSVTSSTEIIGADRILDWQYASEDAYNASGGTVWWCGVDDLECW
jgi:hypothetical protein